MSEKRRRSNPEKQNRAFRRLLIAFLTLLLITSGLGIYGYNRLFVMPVDESSIDLVPFKFEHQETVRNIAAQLAEEGIISSELAMRMKAKLKGLDYVAEEGNYAFSKSMTLDEILAILKEGRTAYDYRMVIEDGTNIDKLLLDFAYSESEIPYLDARINDLTYIQSLREKYSFLPEEILGDGFRHRLEGFLGNGTYYLKYEATIEEFIEQALDKFQENYEKHGWDKKLENDNRSFFEVVTMASVVRGEVLSGDTENQKIVAGVFYNRLNSGMNLGSDVTVGYAINAPDINYTMEQLNYDSPYNTYRNPGLPLGPIMNPGADVIDAVLDYKKNDYHYFLADICDDNVGKFGEIYYANDYSEFNELERKYLGCYRTFD